MWNIPVHVWFVRHIYNPLLGLGVNKALGTLIVFFLSAVSHEWFLSGALGIVSYWGMLSLLA